MSSKVIDFRVKCNYEANPRYCTFLTRGQLHVESIQLACTCALCCCYALCMKREELSIFYS